MQEGGLIEGGILFDWHSPLIARGKPCAFIDRDGVINRRILDGYVLELSQLEYLDSNLRILSRLSNAGIPVVIVSNQSCVGRGLLQSASLRQIMQHVVDRARQAGLVVNGWFCCPHQPEAGCACRKPLGGLLIAASLTNDVVLSRSVMIGDQPSDVDAGTNAGCAASYLVPEGRSDLLSKCVSHVLEHWQG